MPSPFPGMDPYLEAPENWRGVHAKLITYLCDQLNEVLPQPFAAVSEERCYVLRVVIAPAEELELEPIEITERFINILAVRDREVVARIEVLSPVNKRGEGRVKYQTKQRELLKANLHLIEIDLLRGGEHTVAVSRERLQLRHKPHDYLVCLHRAHQHNKVYLWPIRLQDRLPVISVPLTQGTEDVPLDLQRALDTVYDRGAYVRLIDYAFDPIPPLSSLDQVWAKALLGSR